MTLRHLFCSRYAARSSGELTWSPLGEVDAVEHRVEAPVELGLIGERGEVGGHPHEVRVLVRRQGREVRRPELGRCLRNCICTRGPALSPALTPGDVERRKAQCVGVHGRIGSDALSTIETGPPQDLEPDFHTPQRR